MSALDIAFVTAPFEYYLDFGDRISVIAPDSGSPPTGRLNYPLYARLGAAAALAAGGICAGQPEAVLAVLRDAGVPVVPLEHVASSPGSVALTFDDGPHPTITPRVLEHVLYFAKYIITDIDENRRGIVVLRVGHDPREGLLHLLGGRVALDAEHLVVVALGHDRP